MFSTSHKNATFIIVILVLVLGASYVSAYAGSQSRSSSDVYWSWDLMSGDTSNPLGTSELIRSPNGFETKFQTSGLTSGNAATLWFIVFNYPEDCAAGPFQCGPADMGDTPAKGDFLAAGGHVIGGSTFAASLKVGDTRGSGLAEMLECEDCTPGLINPEGALVLLAIHDHGPAQTGQTLQAQISTYLGGCVLPFNGDAVGFALGQDDLPDAEGECSTTQLSPHAPAP